MVNLLSQQTTACFCSDSIYSDCLVFSFLSILRIFFLIKLVFYQISEWKTS